MICFSASLKFYILQHNHPQETVGLTERKIIAAKSTAASVA